MAVYAICDNNCKYETMTKEQIVSMLQQIIETGSLADVDAMKDLTVAAIKETHAGQAIKFWVGTEAEYNALVPTVAAGFVMARIDENGNVYLCTDDSTMQGWHDTAVADAAAAASEVIAEVLSKVTTAENALASHTANKSNPHGVTAAQAGAVKKSNTGYILSVDDLNTAKEFGYYKFTKNTLNVPYADYGEVLVIPWDVNTLSQLAFVNTQRKIFFRTTAVGNGQWLEWKELFTTAGGTLTDILTIRKNNYNYFGQWDANNTDAYMTHVRVSDSSKLLLSLHMDDATTGLEQDSLMIKYYNGGTKTWTAVDMYGGHNICCGTADVSASGAPAVHGGIYQQYE